jgi:GTP-binding protein HflX
MSQGRMAREELRVAAERCVLVQVQLPGTYVDPGDPLRELRALAETAGAEIVGELVQRRQKPIAKTYLGRGKVEELAALVQETRATFVVFDNDLSPAQIRNLEEATSCKILDRSELILDIFASRATTRAAQLQVEIAQLEYTYPRLRAMWSHLGQIVGGAPVGIGTRGPGEQQLEIDRRLAQARLLQLKRELGDIQARRTREVAQRNLDYFTVGIVGYTNAGKSTLFNALTAGGAYAHEKLFATLSTRTERWDLGGGNAVMLSDTVGFIRDLPHHLVASFRSTLEETIWAQLLLIVLDAGDASAPMQLRTVLATLDDIGARAQPRVLVLNKVDRLAGADDLLVWLNRHPDAVPISARDGTGLAHLAERVRGHLLGPVRDVEVAVDMRDGRTIDFLEKRAEVSSRTYEDGRVRLHARVGRRQVEQILARGARVEIDGMDGRQALDRLWPAPSPPPPVRVPPHLRLETR